MSKLKEILQKKKEREERLKSSLDSVVRQLGDLGALKIVLFGSLAKEDMDVSSDLDLLVIMKSNLPRYKRATPMRLLFNPTPCPMDILVFTPREVRRWNGTTNHIVTEALEKGVVAYAKSRY